MTSARREREEPRPKPKPRKIRAWPERFWAKVDKRGPDECWPWVGARDRKGYGHVAVVLDGKSRHTGAHRLAWTIANGDFDSRLFVLHRCDNPPCVNPAHLFLGTNADNMADCHAKGRYATGAAHGSKTQPERFIRRGERAATAKLTERQVAEIYASTLPQRAVAAQYGVSQGTVSHIKLGRRWVHTVVELTGEWVPRKGRKG